MTAPENLKTHQDFRRYYLDAGYVSLGVSTNTGAEILRHETGRVVKLTIAGKDPAVEFARLAQSSGDAAFPRVLAIREGDRLRSWSGAEWRPCAIEMEELYPLQDAEREAYERWVLAYFDWREGKGEKPADELGVELAVDQVISRASDMGGSVRVNLLNSRSIMARVDGDERSLVVIDPWY